MIHKGKKVLFFAAQNVLSRLFPPVELHREVTETKLNTALDVPVLKGNRKPRPPICAQLLDEFL